jgi:biotin transport system substrate-specific component
MIRNPKYFREVLICISTAIIIVLSQISIPTPSGVPATLQTFAIALCSFILGPIPAVIAIILYICLGLIGLPVFAGFSGGIGIVVGVSGGFIWGFILMAFICGLANKINNRFLAPLTGICGLLLCHIAGIIQFAAVSSLPLVQSFMTVSLPFLVKDVISVIGAYFVSVLISAALKKAKLLPADK